MLLAPPLRQAHLDEVVVVEADLHLLVDVGGGDVAVADVVDHEVGHARHVRLDGAALRPQVPVDVRGDVCRVKAGQSRGGTAVAQQAVSERHHDEWT